MALLRNAMFVVNRLNPPNPQHSLLAGTLSGAATFALLPAFREFEPVRNWGVPAES
jgi:hypothetical protein